MRKIFTLFAAMVCSMTMFAQSLQLETKSGQVIANGSTVTVEGEMLDIVTMGMFYSHLHVRNLTDADVSISVQMKSISGDSQICSFGTCSTVKEGEVLPERTGTVSANSAVDLQIEAIIQGSVAGKYFSRTVEVSMWVTTSPADRVTATVTFTNDPTVLNIESAEVAASVVYAKGNVLYYNFSTAADRELQVYDVAGQLQKDIRLDSEAGSLPLEGMAKGLYIYRVVNAGKKVESGKFMVR